MHKLTKQHIKYESNKMKVRLAAETLSNSVANTMQYLMDNGDSQFRYGGATIRFIRYINDCFDIMNTKVIGNENKFKNPINPDNKDEIFAFLMN